MATKVGFIGLGLMGQPMAFNLIKAGYPLTVWNRTPEKCAPLLEAGAAEAGSPAELAAQSEVIFTMLTDGPQVKAVALGCDGIIHGVRLGTIMIDCSSTAPSAARELAAGLAEKGVKLLDAPVSGGPEGASRGALSIMVGGETEVFAEALPLLQILGKTVRHVGPQGAGQLMKLCNQVACGMNILGMCEALALAQQGGLEPALVREVLLAGAAGSWMLENWGPKILAGDYSPGFTVANFQKDLRNVQQEAAGLKLPLPGTALAQQLYRANEAAGEAQESNIAIFKALLRLAGEQV